MSAAVGVLGLAADVSSLLEHEAGRISSLTAAERSALAGLLAQLEHALAT